MKLNNTYYLLRHGEAVSNIRQVVSSWPEKFKNPLTRHGKEMILVSAEILKDKHIDVIFASDLLRTKQTAQIVGKELNIMPKFDTRLREVGFGAINSRPLEELFYLGFEKQRLKHSQKRSESYESVLKRVYGFLKDIDKKYQGKTILIVSHQCPLWILENKVKGFSLAKGLKMSPEEKRIDKGEIRKLI
jgi:broad specificity phosphatase PhoE